ncbi:serine protease [Pseudoxanthomonas winnipegensis]|uniref:S1 family peptidase n=1 Tax=Pseudoxanthomonas winnipegensis TaxID=2480810 RepID=UPI0025789843|nr:serine protease [Pseudoxanthomonas winnipegensis]WJI15095.1 serine protease [Pseudoxanthomonas winnipegensis]
MVGRLTPDGVQMLGTGFLFRPDGYIATTQHVVGVDPSNLVILAPHISKIDEYQDLSDNSCVPIPVTVEQLDPIRDLAVLKGEIIFNVNLPSLSSFDRVAVGSDLCIFGYPHCVEGRRALTFQKAELGAKVKISEKGVSTNHAVINVQARPGQSGSIVFNPQTGTVAGVLVGAWAPAGGGGISLGGINPRELHQTTHCVPASYLEEMV